MCDVKTGKCFCFDGFGGVACNNWIEPTLNKPGVNGKVYREVYN